MLAGHYSTALVAHAQFPKGSLLYFLLASQIQDLAWLTFHFLGLEPTGPGDMLDMTLQNLDVDMLFSHDLLPQMIWMTVVFGVGQLIFNNIRIGLVGAALVLGHFILDMISGYPHHVFGPETHEVGFALYQSNVYLAVLLEGVISAVCLWYYFRSEAQQGIVRSFNNKMAIIGFFAFGVCFLMFAATTSMREWFGLPPADAEANTTMPIMVVTYLSMMGYLYFVARTPKATAKT